MMKETSTSPTWNSHLSDKSHKRMHGHTDLCEIVNKKRLKSFDAKSATSMRPSINDAKESQPMQQHQVQSATQWEPQFDNSDLFLNQLITSNNGFSVQDEDQILSMLDSSETANLLDYDFDENMKQINVNNIDDDCASCNDDSSGSECEVKDRYDRKKYFSTKNSDKAARNSAGSTNSLQQPRQSNSVLMNLLVSGCDVNAGYICLSNSRPSDGVANESGEL